MPTFRLQSNVYALGASFNSTVDRTADGGILHEVTTPQAYSGTVSSYTAGPPEEWVINAPGHNLAVNDIVTMYWTGGRRYHMTVTNVSGDDVTVQDGSLSGGGSPPTNAGDSVILAEQITVDTDFDSSLLSVLALYMSSDGLILFRDASDTVLLTVDLTSGELWEWHSGGAGSNPLSGTVSYAELSQKDTSEDKSAKIVIMYDSAS